MKKTLILLLIFLMPVVPAQDIELKHIGFGDTQAAILLSLKNIGKDNIIDPIVYLDGEYYQKLSINIKPETTISFYVFADSGNHTIDLSYKGRNYTVNVINTIVEPVQEVVKEKKPINRWFLFGIVLIPFIVAIYLLLKKPKLV